VPIKIRRVLTHQRQGIHFWSDLMMAGLSCALLRRSCAITCGIGGPSRVVGYLDRESEISGIAKAASPAPVRRNGITTAQLIPKFSFPSHSRNSEGKLPSPRSTGGRLEKRGRSSVCSAVQRWSGLFALRTLAFQPLRRATIWSFSSSCHMLLSSPGN
jgi:hypothetical protein